MSIAHCAFFSSKFLTAYPIWVKHGHAGLKWSGCGCLCRLPERPGLQCLIHLGLMPNRPLEHLDIAEAAIIFIVLGSSFRFGSTAALPSMRAAYVSCPRETRPCPEPKSRFFLFVARLFVITKTSNLSISSIHKLLSVFCFNNFPGPQLFPMFLADSLQTTRSAHLCFLRYPTSKPPSA